MKVKVTKTMVKFLNDSIPEYHFSMGMVNTWYYSDPIDYDMKTGKTKVITVNYPPEYYAMPGQISTSDLSKCFKASDHTVSGFIKQIRRQIEI